MTADSFRGRAGRVGLLASLYFAQGLPFGLFSHALPVLMREHGESLKAIGFANLLAIPWALKFLWAPAIDRISGPRKRVIVPLNILAALLLFGLSQVTPGALAGLMVVVLLCNLVAATQDIATDGFAVELLPEKDRGVGNGVQVGGYRVGMIVGGGVLLALFPSLGWERTFATAGAAVALATIPMLLAPAVPRSPPKVRTAIQEVLFHTWFAAPGAQRWFWLLVLFKFGDAFGTGMVKPLFVDLGMGKEEIGTLLGVGGSVAAVVGAGIGGWAAGRFGRRTCLLAFGTAQLLSLGLYIGVATEGASWAPAAVVTEHLFSGMATATLFTAMMDATRTEKAGVDYTVQASVQVISSGIAAIVSGVSAEALGYSGHFGLSILLAALPVWLVATWPKDAPARFALR